MSQLLFSIRSLKSVIDLALAKAQFAVFNAAALEEGLREISRYDTENAVSNLESFAALCGFQITFRDHQREVLFSL